MKLNRLHSITLTSLLALLLFTGCQDETDALPSESRRTITLDLGIAMTRATEDDQVVYGEANDLKIWLFDQNNNFLRYIEVDDPQFTGRDLQGNPVESVKREFDITDVTQLQFRVLLNTEGLTLQDAEGNALTLGENTTNIDDIDAATFQFGTPLPDADNKVPMYGTCDAIPITTSKDYHAEIPLTRAVGKLELFFTKESESEASELTINSVSITHDPDKGYLKKPGENNYDLEYSTDSRSLFSEKKEITAVLTQEEEATVGNFSEYENNSAKMQRLFSTYLLENPNGGKWSDATNPDFSYPYDEETSTAIEYETTRYKMTVNYTLGSQTKEQIIYLPAIERNVWNKIFARVKSEEAMLELTYEVNPWEREDITVNYEDNLSYRSDGWDEEDEEGNTILELMDNGRTMHFLDAEATATLRFVINSPKVATWRAQLTGVDVTYFEFVDADGNHLDHISGTADFNGNTAVQQIIRIKCTQPESEETHRVELRVYATIGGIDYEMDLTDTSGEDMRPGSEAINHFTILQGR